MEFEVIVNDSYIRLFAGSDLSPSHNKYVLGLINDFEDGQWRYQKFQEYIWDNIAETALSYEERSNLVGNPLSVLRRAAKNLRLIDQESKKKIGEGSELAEILLYGIMRDHYKALPVVPKIFYKQNSQDTVKGSDSVHVVISDDKSDFTLWFGEAKFLSDISDSRLDVVVDSVMDSLKSDKLKKENSIISSVGSLRSLVSGESLYERISKSLSNKASIDTIKSKINIPILLLHNCSITSEQSEISDEYIENIRKFYLGRAESYFKKQVKKISSEIFKYSEVKFHLILFPVPDKEKVVNQFVKNVVHFKGDCE
ncbi:MAG: DUF1837 domain-containing protein [Alcanivoracaceae bacterium]